MTDWVGRGERREMTVDDIPSRYVWDPYGRADSGPAEARQIFELIDDEAADWEAAARWCPVEPTEDELDAYVRGDGIRYVPRPDWGAGLPETAIAIEEEVHAVTSGGRFVRQGGALLWTWESNR